MTGGILAVTGHRPENIRATSNGGLRITNAYDAGVYRGLVEFAGTQLEAEAPELVVTGMALGWDQAIAEACLDSGLPYLAAVPFKEQPDRWGEKARKVYFRLLKGAREIRYVNEPGYAAWKMHARNEWMVDNSDRVLALWNGDADGGTARCVHYATKRARPIRNCWDAWLTFTRAGVTA